MNALNQWPHGYSKTVSTVDYGLRSLRGKVKLVYKAFRTYKLFYDALFMRFSVVNTSHVHNKIGITTQLYEALSMSLVLLSAYTTAAPRGSSMLKIRTNGSITWLKIIIPSFLIFKQYFFLFACESCVL